MNIEAIVDVLYRSIDENGFVRTINAVFGMPLNISIPFTTLACDTSIDELDLSVRSQNCLKRAGIMYVRELIDYACSDELLKIRNLGRKSYIEIKTKLLVFGYENLSIYGKKSFLCDLVKESM